MHAENRKHDAKQAADQAQGQMLDQQQTHDPGPGCSKGGAHAQFAAAPTQSNQCQIGDVGQRRQQDQSGDPQQQGAGINEIGGVDVLERRGVHFVTLITRVLVRIAGLEPARDRRQLQIDPLQIRARRGAPDRLDQPEAAVVVVVGIGARWTVRQGDVDVVGVGQLGDWGQHANDLVGAIVHGQGGADDVGIGAGVFAPEFVAEQHQRRRSVVVLSFGKVPAEDGIYSQGGKEGCGHHPSLHPQRFVKTEQGEGHGVELLHPVQRGHALIIGALQR